MLPELPGVFTLAPMMPVLAGPRFLFDAPADKGADGGGNSDPSPSPQPSPSGGDTTGAEPPSPTPEPEKKPAGRADPSQDPDLLEAMRMTEELSKSDGGDGEEGTSGTLAPEGGDDNGKSETPSSDDAGDDDPPYREGFDPNDGVEVEGETYFYHPSEHGKETGQGTIFKDRNTAEMAWGNKVARIQDLVGKLKELGKDVGPIELPAFLDNPEDEQAYEKLMDIDYPLQLQNDELRTHIQQADKLITHLNKREERVRTETESTQQSEEIRNEVQSVYDTILESAQELNILDKIQRSEFQTNDDLAAGMRKAVESQVANELKEDVKAYTELKNDENARIDDPKYADKLEKMYTDIEKKRNRLMNELSDKHLSVFNKLPELQEKVQKIEQSKKQPEISEKQRLQTMNTAFQGLQREMKDQHPIFMSTDPTGAKHFHNWAMKNAEEFDGLQTEYAWGKALRSFDKHVEQKRAEIRKAKIEEENRKKEEANKEIPGYGDREELLGKQKPRTKHDAMESEMEQLVKETEQRLG
jgi:hypothetical protein